MTQLLFEPIPDKYNRVYCPICIKSWFSTISKYEDVYCPDCHEEGKKTKMLFTVIGEEECTV